MQVEILMDVDSLFSDARMLSSFEGKYEYDEKGDSLYDVIRLLQQDRPLMERFVGEAMRDVTKVLREFITGVNGDLITCEMPRSFNEAFVEDVKDGVKRYAVNFSFYLYLKMKNERRAKDYLELANQNLRDLRGKVYYRKKPEKRRWNGTGD